MKTKITMLKKGTALLCFILLLAGFSTKSYGASHITLSIENCTVTANEIQFDYFVMNDGTTQLNHSLGSFRLVFAATLIPANTPMTLSYVPGSSDVPSNYANASFFSFAVTNTATNRLLTHTMTSGAAYTSASTGPLYPFGVKIKIGRYKLTPTGVGVNFNSGANVGLGFFATGNGINAFVDNGATAIALNTGTTNTNGSVCSLTTPSSCSMTASIASQINVLCFGGSTGSATATTTNAPGAVTYAWNTSPIQTGATASGLSAGPYTVVATSGACTASATVTITQPASALSASASQDAPILCNGGSTTVTVSATGGTGPYTGTGTFSATAGSNTYTVTDANGCSSSSTVEVTQPSALLLSLTHENALCFGESTGSITAVGSGGTAPYTYSISSLPFQPSGNFSGLASGNYFVDVKDANGCVTGSTISVGQPVALTASATSTPTSTPVATDGTALVSVNGGTTPYSITWNTIPVQTGAFASGLAAGSYTATIVDQNGCTTTASVTVSSPSCALLVSATHTDVSCFGGTNGTASASSTGGTGVVTYTIMPGGGSNTTGLFTGLASGIYTITGVDENLCSSSATVTVGSPTELVGSSSATAIACNGGSATVTVSATGGTLPYSGTGSFTVTAGTYSYTITDDNGCTATTSITVTEPTAVVASSSATAIACNGGSSTVTVSATGGTAPYTGTGSFSEVAGTYTYTVTDANGCTASTSVTITEPAVLSASATSTNASCPTCTDGTVSISSVTGGTAPYTYTDLTNLGSGNYCITVTDANGCTAQACATVGAAACSIVASSSQGAAILCNGGTTTVTVSQTGGTLPVSGTGTFTVGAGTHTYTVTDVNGCSSTTSITVTEPSAVVASSSATAILCNGGSSTVTVSATGGTAPYTGTGSFSEVAGTYTYTVTDANGCTATTSITVTEPSAVVASSSASAILCNGGSSTVTVSATGGTAPYTGTGSFSEVAGTYTYTVTDANGCTATTSVTITEPSALSASSSATAIACNGGSSTVTVSATGGTAPYTGTGSFSEVAGTYTYTVTDANGCTATTSVTITEPSAVVASSSATAILCNGGSSTVTVSATGGTAPYTGTGSFSEVAGTYTYTVTDANGCTATTTITITEPTAVVASSSATAILCNGGSSTVTVSATGGTAPYTGTGSFSEVAGTYTYTVTDANGCTATTTVTITEPSAVVASSSATAILCFGGSSTVTVSATGGTAPYTGTGSFSEVAGTYTYTVTDANGCTATTTITITEPAASVVASATQDAAILCNGGSTTVTVSATGGTTPYSGTGTFTVGAGTHNYTVTDANGCSSTTSITVTEPTAVVASSSATAILCNGGSSTVTVSATGGTAPYTGTGSFTVGAGTHNYTVTDANGCTATTSVTVTEPSAVVASSSATAILCNGGSSTVTVSATGGTAPYSGTGSFSETAGTYTYTVTDANGCSATTTVTITEPAVLVASATAQGTIACFGGSASVDVTATGGTAPYSGTGTFTQFAGTTTYTVTDANGCTSTSSVTLTEPAKVEGTTTTTPSSCAGSDGTATVSATGGTGSYTYLWSNGQTSATATGLAIGTYTVVITDANGCTGSASATVGGSGGSPATPGAIAGPAGACRNTSGIVFSVAAVPGATSYIWTLPSGATGSSTTNSITVSFGSTYGGGFICVAAVNTCGTSLTSCMNIPVITVYPGLPSVIVGPAAACAGGTYTYSTTSSNALSYTWTVTGSGVTIVSGQGTNTVQVSVPVGFGQGSVQVRGVNCNGISAVRGMTITGTPTHSNTITGPNFVCAGGSATYTMSIVTGATAHVWSVTGDATVASQTTTSTTTTATINFGPTWTSGIVSVAASNSCGSFSRSFTVNSVPTQPGAISGPGAGLCGLTGVTYSIAAVAGATSYTWTVPVGVTIVSTAPSGLSIVVDFTPAFVSNSAPICVSASNSCGTGPARCFTVTSRPAAPVITGPASVCKSNSAVVYTASAVASATSYSWSVTGGASIAPAGSSATVNFNTALSTTAVVRVNAINACGASQPGAKTVAVSLFCRTAADDVTVSNTELGAYPNPTSGKATVSFNAASESKYLVKVTDMIGNALVSDVVNAIEGYNTQDIDLTGVAKGIYMISVTAADGSTETIRLVVE